MSPISSDEQLFNDLQSLLAEVFKVEVSQIDPSAQLGEWPAWDSMAHMDLMVALEERFGVEINADTISQLISVPAILEHLRTNLNVRS
ncbi:MAG TPA: acyl carrier protein [Anaerolineales bacterium]|jgi:acyl carrier protein|nr:acyl carrier protein [Anaerolineales bacterium]